MVIARMITQAFRWVKTHSGSWECLFISSHFYLNSPRSWCMREHPAPCQLQCIYGGQRLMESSLTPSLWIQTSGPQIQAPAHVAGRPTTQLVGFLPSSGKSRTGTEPGCLDPNPQFTDWLATGREVCWHGKHSLGHKWSQRISPGLKPMLLNIPKNQRFPFSSPFFPPWSVYSTRAEAW